MTIVKVSIENYNANRGVYSPLVEHNGIICGFWLCGQNYRNPTQYYDQVAESPPL